MGTTRGKLPQPSSIFSQTLSTMSIPSTCDEGNKQEGWIMAMKEEMKAL